MLRPEGKESQEWQRIMEELHELRARKRWLTWYNPNFRRELLTIERVVGKRLSRGNWPPESVLLWKYVEVLDTRTGGGHFLRKWELKPYIGDNLSEWLALKSLAKKGGWSFDKKLLPRDQLWYRLRYHESPRFSYHEIAKNMDRNYPLDVDQYVIRWLEKTQPTFLNCVDPQRKVCNSEKMPFSCRANLLLYRLGMLKIAISNDNNGWPAFGQWPPVKIGASEELLKGQEYYVRYDFDCTAPNSAFTDKPRELEALRSKEERRQMFLHERGIYIGEGKELSDFEQLIKQAIRRMEITIKSIEPVK